VTEVRVEPLVSRQGSYQTINMCMPWLPISAVIYISHRQTNAWLKFCLLLNMTNFLKQFLGYSVQIQISGDRELRANRD